MGGNKKYSPEWTEKIKADLEKHNLSGTNHFCQLLPFVVTVSILGRLNIDLIIFNITLFIIVQKIIKNIYII